MNPVEANLAKRYKLGERTVLVETRETSTELVAGEEGSFNTISF